TDMLAEAYAARGRSIDGLGAAVSAEAERIHFPAALLDRSLNVDLSGGEKKRNETVQLALLEPKFAILDELDSGLDIDALRDCARRVEAATHDSDLGVLAITHYNRLLAELHPDHVHILVKGRIVASGGPDLADQLERDGYEAFTTDDADDADGAASPTGSYDDLFAL
ncbi:MAG: Fe-S cluster assembly ATPase SufC, partial [Actinomycetota bacterium]